MVFEIILKLDMASDENRLQERILLAYKHTFNHSICSRVGSFNSGTACICVYVAISQRSSSLFIWTLVYFNKLVVSPFDTKGLVHPSGRRKAIFE